MRIGFFSDSYFPEIDGVTYTLKLWRDRLEEQGHEVYIVYPASEDYEPGDGEVPVPSIPNPFYEGYNIPLPTSMDRLPELDIVHCHTPFSVGRLGKLYADRNDLPKVYTHHTPVEEYFEQNTHSELIANAIARAYLPLENNFLKKFDVVTASTPDVSREVDVVQLAVGIDMEFFQPSESFLEEDSVIGYSGRISMEKNVDELLKLAEVFDGKMVIVGEGPQREELENIAPENVEFHDFLPREKLPGFYSGLDVFVTASTGDTLGLSTLEANACGTPVLAPDVHPFDRTIKEENGARYNHGDLEDMTEKLSYLVQNSFETRAAVEQYSVSNTVKQLQDIYTGISR